MWPKFQLPADFLAFTKEILKVKHNFLRGVISKILMIRKIF